MLEGFEIVVFSDEWGRHPFSCQHIMEHFLPGNRLVWVTPTGLRNPSLKWSDMKRIAEKLRKWFSPQQNAGKAADDRVTAISPCALPFNNLKPVRMLNNLIAVRKVAGELNDGTRRIVITTLPFTAEYVDRFQAEVVVYYIVDDFLEWPGIDRSYIARQEELLLAKADTLMASASQLCELKAQPQKRMLLVPHGVDYAHFSAHGGGQKAAAVMSGIKRPIVGFFGAISPWLDFELLQKVAESCPDLSFVFIGPVDADVTPLSALDNVTFLGKVPYADLPRYAASFDVGIIPFLVNKLTLSVNPLKLLEYFACGLPVVSTPLPEVARYGEHVHLAGNADDFARSLRIALAAGAEGREERRELARSNSWQSRAELVAAGLKETLEAQREVAAVRTWRPEVAGAELEEALEC